MFLEGDADVDDMMQVVGRWRSRAIGLKAEFVLVLLPGVVDGRPVRTESAPFLLNAEPGGGMGHYRQADRPVVTATVTATQLVSARGGGGGGGNAKTTYPKGPLGGPHTK